MRDMIPGNERRGRERPVRAMDKESSERKATAHDRVLDAARTLLAEHGVSGTSLQMIADHLGVTKAAVYHQFHTKDEIVLALLQKPLEEMLGVLAETEAEDTREAQLDVLLKGLVNIVLENPEAVSLIQADPEVGRLLHTRQIYREIAARVDRVMAGPHRTSASRIASALFGAGLLVIGHNALIGDIDPEIMRSELPRLGRRILL